MSFKYLIFICLFGAVASFGEIFACSVVQGVYEWGGNYDWHPQKGLVFQSPSRQIKRAHLAGERGIAWVSRYKSLTVSQFGRDFPMQGLNERGLSGAVLIGAADYPETGITGTITENLWLQFQLDQYESVAEVADHADDLAIKKISANLHWFMCDATGECAVIEFRDGQARVYKGEDLLIPALTNSPYAAALGRYSDWRRDNAPLPQGYEAFARFIRLANAVSSGETPDSKEKIARLLADVAHKTSTAWQTVFDTRARTMTVHLGGKFEELSQWTETGFDAKTFPECGQELRVMDLSKPGVWSAYRADAVRDLFVESARGTNGLGFEVMNEILRQAESVNCDIADKIR